MIIGRDWRRGDCRQSPFFPGVMSRKSETQAKYPAACGRIFDLGSAASCKETDRAGNGEECDV